MFWNLFNCQTMLYSVPTVWVSNNWNCSGCSLLRKVHFKCCYSSGSPLWCEASSIHLSKALRRHLRALGVERGGSSLPFCKDVFTQLLEESAGLYWQKGQADSTQDLYCKIRIVICEDLGVINAASKHFQVFENISVLTSCWNLFLLRDIRFLCQWLENLSFLDQRWESERANFLSVVVGTSRLWYSLIFTLGFICSKEVVLTIKKENVVLGKPLTVDVLKRWDMWALIDASMLLISQECLTNQRCYWLAHRLGRLCFVDCKISEDQVFNLR